MRVIGHRGARGLAPENTILGFQVALRHLRYGFDMLEFDVRVTKDNVPVLCHNKTINDPDGQKLKIKQHNYKELKAHFPALTTLAEALNYIDNKVTPYIEVKPGEPVKPILVVLKKFIGGMYSTKQLRLASKSQKTLLELHEALPEVPTIVIDRWSGIRATHRARQLGTKELAMNQVWLWWGFINLMAKQGYQLYSYPTNSTNKARAWVKHGLAGVITDFPDRFSKQ